MFDLYPLPSEVVSVTSSSDSEKNEPQHTEQSGPSGETGSSSRSTMSATKTKDHSDESSREQLTPEIVEDEAIRGDFMMRWVAVLLGFLLGCTLITRTETLVHIKSGQYILQHGLTWTDVFSSSAEGRSWVNLNWLFDVVVAGVYGFGELFSAGGVMLSLFTGVIAAALMWAIVHTSRRDIPSWWGTICGTIALLAFYHQLTATPEIITLLGLAFTMYFLHRWKEDNERKYLIRLVVLFLLWANLDPRMFLGLALLLAYALGEALGDWLGFPSLGDGKRRKALWLTVAACVGVALINPFGWHSLLSPISLYQAEYPAFQVYNGPIRGYEQIQYLMLTDGAVWSWDLLNLSVGAGLLLIVSAAVAMGLNFRRLDLGDVCMWLAFVAFSVLAVHELAAAAIVFSVLATLNAQQWYEHSFRQTYSVQKSELIFSRGGRAATVLAQIGIAYLAISGVSPLGLELSRQTDIGFHPDLTASIEATREEFEDSFDDRPFNLGLSQGDVLIWIDQKPFIDGRLKLFAGEGKDNLVDLHDKTRRTLVSRSEDASGERRWKPVFDQYHITHVAVQLDDRLPRHQRYRYNHLVSLLESADWRLTRLGASNALFYRTDLLAEQTPADWCTNYPSYMQDHDIDLVAMVFRNNHTKGPEAKQFWPAEPTTLEKFLLFLRRPVKHTPNAIEEASHFDILTQAVIMAAREKKIPFAVNGGRRHPNTLAVGMALAHLTIQKSIQGVNADPQNASAYRSLGMGYASLGELEDVALRTAALRVNDAVSREHLGMTRRLINHFRYLQAVNALQQSLILEPDHVPTLRAMARICHAADKFDLSIAMVKRTMEVNARNESKLTEKERKDANKEADRLEFIRNTKVRVRGTIRTVGELIELIAKQRKTISTSPADRGKRRDLAQFAGDIGFPLTALELVEEDIEMLKEGKDYEIQRIAWLQQVGRSEEASNEINRLHDEKQNRPVSNRGFATWREVLAFDALIRYQPSKARGVWAAAAEKAYELSFSSLIDSLPLTMQSELSAAQRIKNRKRTALWPVENHETVYNSLFYLPQSTANMMLLAALSAQESGDRKNALELFRRVGQMARNSPASVLADFYLALLDPASAPRKPTGTKPKEQPKSKEKPTKLKKSAPPPKRKTTKTKAGKTP